MCTFLWPLSCGDAGMKWIQLDLTGQEDLTDKYDKIEKGARKSKV